MSDAQQKTLDRYQALLEANATSHLVRAAREVGLLEALRSGQKTLTELAEICGLRSRPTRLLLDCLVALEVVEHYAEDYALSPVAQLLTQNDRDLRDGDWGRLVAALKADAPWPAPDENARQNLAASQWVQTAAAMQVASVLEIGTRNRGWHLLDFGCGAGVWSAAMAYRDPESRVTAVDTEGALELARQTADSIQLGERWHGLAVDPFSASLDADAFDAALIAGWLHTVGEEEVMEISERVLRSLRPGGLLVLPDIYRDEQVPELSKSLEALRVEVTTQLGRLRRPTEMQQMLQHVGYVDCQFAALSASRQRFGLLIARRASL